MTKRVVARLRETPPATLTAFTLSIVVHTGLMLWFGPATIRPPQIAAFEPIEVALVSEPTPRQILKSTLIRAINSRTLSPEAIESKESQPETGAAEQVRAASSNQSDEPLVESRYDVRSLNNPRPPYPLAARRRGMEGRVVLHAHVRDDGLCAEVELKQSSGHGLLDSSALQTVKRWRFVPASRGGVAVASWVEIPITFRLQDVARNDPAGD